MVNVEAVRKLVIVAAHKIVGWAFCGAIIESDDNFFPNFRNSEKRTNVL